MTNTFQRYLFELRYHHPRDLQGAWCCRRILGSPDVEDRQIVRQFAWQISGYIQMARVSAHEHIGTCGKPYLAPP